MRALGVALLLAGAGCAVTSREADGPLSPRPRPHRTSDKLHVHVATHGVRLGSYTILIRWDPAQAVIERIVPCTNSKFPGPPEFDEERFNQGKIRVWGLTTRRSHEIPEEYDLFNITFRSLRPEKVQVKVEVEALYDASKRPQPLTGRLNVFPPELDFSP
jgi:hypothetical protein